MPERLATQPVRAIALHPDDNVVICTGALQPGTPVTFDDAEIVSQVAVALGHKLARRPLASGDKVLRHGIPIGTMTADAAIGEHVHRHNLQSDYISSHERDVLRGKAS